MSTKDYLEKDYYKTLGVAKTAKPAEIKTAYRKLARKYHPDSNQGDAKAEERFKEISEAYSVLSDEKRRKEYDEALTHTYSPDVTEDTCVEIFQPGYKVGDRILRPARVAVAEPATGPDGSSNEAAWSSDEEGN